MFFFNGNYIYHKFDKLHFLFQHESIENFKRYFHDIVGFVNFMLYVILYFIITISYNIHSALIFPL